LFRIEDFEMQRVLGLVVLCGAASCAAASAAPGDATHQSSGRTATKTVASRQSPISVLAPADEYFGPLKLSILGIRNTIHDLGARYDVNHEIGRQTFTSALLTEKAIHDWEHRYPRDGQVPKAIYLLQRLYTKVLTVESRARATIVARWMFVDYASSPQGKQLKKTIALEHLAPIPVDLPATADADAEPSGAPATGSPAPAPSGVVPPGAATPAPSPSSSASP